MTMQIATGQVTLVTGTATQIVAARAGRKELRLQGLQTSSLVGPDDSLTASNGFRYAIDTASIPTEEAVWGIRVSGTGVVSYMEIYDAA